MEEFNNPSPLITAHQPWNKGKLIGAKPPLRSKLSRFSAATARLELPITCLGTEPFWSLTINSVRRASYSDPETKERLYRISDFRRSGRDATMRLDANGHVSIVAENCSDGMSDNQFPYAVHILLPDGRELKGCCG
jgi:uncharacterized membrane protein